MKIRGEKREKGFHICMWQMEVNLWGTVSLMIPQLVLSDSLKSFEIAHDETHAVISYSWTHDTDMLECSKLS